ncbi:FxLYD domain-containing protein [Methyloligella sp. 2.7D]|uniref:FxLYD domain-containing protein n=1 Tax=unclassified Methyloligella TaxID=2625955 RepID=UPI001FEE892D|nr:FxLYD domain-containing protein [Methyloligella sp. GL2]
MPPPPPPGGAEGAPRDAGSPSPPPPPGEQEFEGELPQEGAGESQEGIPEPEFGAPPPPPPQSAPPEMGQGEAAFETAGPGAAPQDGTSFMEEPAPPEGVERPLPGDADFQYGAGAPGQAPQGDADFETGEAEALAGAAPKQKSAGLAGKGVLLGWGVLGLVVAIILAIFAAMPGFVTSVLPGASSLYGALGISSNSSGLALENVHYGWGEYQGQTMLRVEGDIVNLTDGEVALPNVLIALLDENGDNISEWMAPAGEGQLGAGGKTAFATQIPSPPGTMKSIKVRFQKAKKSG